ncbi:hypothetical protein [Helicobacter canis]|uniref:hypothetical protein n=1 Tax=Helicobacter canis TaxID=29419 RepID=UPI0011C0593B|nr:hypothetical protein [Helicobacter canis]
MRRILSFARFWWILRGGLAHLRRVKSLRPPLENPQNHRKILESFFHKRLFCHRELCDSKAWRSIKTQKWILGLSYGSPRRQVGSRVREK